MFRLLIDRKKCAEPGSLDIIHYNDGWYGQNDGPMTLMGICYRLEGEDNPISAGQHEIRVQGLEVYRHNYGCPGLGARDDGLRPVLHD